MASDPAADFGYGAVRRSARERWLFAELLRLKGELLLHSSR
jgi:hypothetical protein